jgi:hypothetical protein
VNGRWLHAGALISVLVVTAACGGGGGGSQGPQVTGQWAWMGGSNTTNSPEVYGTRGMAAASNVPGARFNAVIWVDGEGNLWLFAGTNHPEFFNDLWKFAPSTGLWTWVSGASTPNAVGIYGSLGVASAGNIPGARASAVSWIDGGGNLWLLCARSRGFLD